MGYNLTIGNAVPEFSKDYGELSARWVVPFVKLPDAPTFPNDDLTVNSNGRSPSYIGWSDFCDEVGLKRLFYDESDGLLRPHPGCKLLTVAHHTEVLAALQRRQTISARPPGFPGESTYNKETQTWEPPPDADKYDPQLARLLWLEWWMRWALANCETPAFENT